MNNANRRNQNFSDQWQMINSRLLLWLLQARLRQLDCAIRIGSAGDGTAAGVIYVSTAQSCEVNIRTAITAKLIIHHDPASPTKSGRRGHRRKSNRSAGYPETLDCTGGGAAASKKYPVVCPVEKLGQR